MARMGPEGTSNHIPLRERTPEYGWVENTPNGLNPGYHPVDINADRREQATGESAARSNRKQPTADHRDSGRITELNNTASVDFVSSAARKMTIGTDVIKYVIAVKEAYAEGHRRRGEGDPGPILQCACTSQNSSSWTLRVGWRTHAGVFTSTSSG